MHSTNSAAFPKKDKVYGEWAFLQRIMCQLSLFSKIQEDVSVLKVDVVSK